MESTSTPSNNPQSIDLAKSSDEESISDLYQICPMSSYSSTSASIDGNVNQHIDAKESSRTLTPTTNTTSKITTTPSVKELFCTMSPYD